MMYLKYIGKGYWLPGVPARDLTKSEATYYGVKFLIESGLYERYSKPKPEENRAVQPKLETRGIEDGRD